MLYDRDILSNGYLPSQGVLGDVGHGVEGDEGVVGGVLESMCWGKEAAVKVIRWEFLLVRMELKIITKGDATLSVTMCG